MTRPRALPFVAALAIAGACTPAETPPPATPPTPTAEVAAPPAPPPPAAEAKAGAMPADVEIYLELTDIPGLLGAAKSAVGAPAFAAFYKEVTKDSGLPEATVERILNSIVSVHFGGRRAGDDLKAALSVMIEGPQIIRELITAGKITEGEPFGPYGKRLVPADKPGKDKIIWFEGPRLLAFGDDPALQGISAVLEGRTPALGDAKRPVPTAAPGERRHVTAFVAPALLDRLTEGKVTFPEPLAIFYSLWEGGLRGTFRAAVDAPGSRGNLPIPPPRSLALARRLPSDTAGYVALSTGLPGGPQSAANLLAAVLLAGGRDADKAVREINGGLSSLGLSLTDLVASLGDEGVLGGVLRTDVKSEKDLEKSYAIVYVQQLSDGKPAERLIKLARDELSRKKNKAKVRPEGGGFSADLLGGAPMPYARVKVAGGRLFLGIGPRDLVDHALKAVDSGKGTLGDDAAHARALGGLPPASHLRLWVDAGRLADMALAVAPPSQRAELSMLSGITTRGPGRVTSGLSFSLVPGEDRIGLELDEVNGIGLFAAVGIYGVRRYLARSKSAEARNSLGAIARAAAAAYEREVLTPQGGIVHSLCKSAQPVPAKVPRGNKYMPSSDPGQDYEAGDAATGWKCLKFAMTEPQYYQYTYIVGGPYKGPKRGGPDPGPKGFEVSAEGDLNGDGVTSLFTRTGVIDPATGSVRLSTEIFVDKEDE